MSGNFELDAEFSAIMAASRNRPASHRPVNAVMSSAGGANDNSSMTPSGGGYGPSRIHPRNERPSPQSNIQVKYDTIVKGFKVLEVNYEESQRKLAITEEKLSAVDAAHTALIAKMEEAQQILHDHETEINTLRNDVETNKTAQSDREAEIETIRKELEESKVALADCEERIKTIRMEVEEILSCGICQSSTIQPFSDPDEIAESFDANRFAVLMAEIWAEAGTNRAREAQVVDYVFAGTSANPLDLTGVWN
ncbi:hypothetical protein BDM02DRAFT_3191782 [Thelephora ganbajun]|uniref:Uncharacterized protein n=1 Tax=Thelephora ganbajun TaxID=370292 RepID=A0ACB6Z1B6_THEGA|nr:hypothetical protein BDM02DRAFT_3191782 [Thelephora ganbajun]